MTDLEQRNARALARMEAKHNEPPEDVLDTPAVEAKKLEMWNERILDINGYFIEGISEQPDYELNRLAMMVKNNQNGTHTETIGACVSRWVISHCKPSNDEVIEALNEKPFEDY
jgi:hypothetical protein